MTVWWDYILFDYNTFSPALSSWNVLVRIYFYTSFCLCRFQQHNKREEWKQRYPLIVFLCPASLLSDCFQGFLFIKPGFFCPCVFWFFPESEIRARLQSASPTPCRCKTARDTLIHSPLVMQSPIMQQSIFIPVFRNTWMVKDFHCWFTSEQHAVVKCFGSVYQAWDIPSPPLLTCTLTPMKFYLVTHVQLPH